MGFVEVAPEHSGINFQNILTESDSLNYFTYSYLYMGGGVSVGDINNDGLLDLYFTGNMVPNKLYLNQGDLRFKDISDQAGVSGDNRWYTGTTMADVNADGLLDIYVSVGGKFGPKENQLFINNGDLTFTEKAADLGLDDVGNSVQSTFFDFDQDGDLDVYVANYPPTKFSAPNAYYKFKMENAKDHESDHLYRNDGGVFTDITDEAGLRTYGLSLSATVGDLNGDGWPDIYVSNDFSSPDFLYLNNKNGTFRNVVKEATKQTSFYGMGTDIADYNNDGLLDIIQVDMDAKNNRRAKANMASMNPAIFWGTVNAGFHYQYMHNTLQLNNGVFNGDVPDFSNTSRIAGVSSSDWSWGPLLADFDNDGWKDLFVSNGTRREINNRDYFLNLAKVRNKRDSLLERSLAIPSEKIDNFIYKNNGDFTFTQVNQEWGLQHPGFSNGAVYADLDNDGDLELVTNNIDEAATLFKNNAPKINSWISIGFRGPKENPLGVGAQVWVYSKAKKQFQELTMTRGFQSSISPRMHFGLGNEPLDSIRVVWPNGNTQSLRSPMVNRFLTIDYTESVAASETKRKVPRKKLFQTLVDTASTVIHLHEENIFDDFDREVLLPHKMSNLGPAVISGDVNGDGLDDLIVGSSTGAVMQLYLQRTAGFEKKEVPAFFRDGVFEEMDLLLWDADGDGDLDLYAVSGSNEYDSQSIYYQDRLYRNDGLGNFTKEPKALPTIRSSGSKVKLSDFDGDGDLDLLVAGRQVPGRYPMPARSILLENQSTEDDMRFVDVTKEVIPEIETLGMVTDFLWTDIDGNGWEDIILVGEWMPIEVFLNFDSRFYQETKKFGLENKRGWWFSIEEGDFDGDGDQDFIVGNLGQNYKYQANDNQTFDVYYRDFDGNKTGDIVLSYFNDGEKFPVRGRECSSQQMPGIKDKFKNYESFSKATLEDIYTEGYLESSLHYQVQSFASIHLENKDGRLIVHPLPKEVQLSSVNSILIDDYNGDNYLDVLMAGNLYQSEVETPRNDAGIGLLLEGDGQGGFKPVLGRDSGFYAPGDVKDITTMVVNGREVIVLAKNQDYLQFIQKLK